MRQFDCGKNFTVIKEKHLLGTMGFGIVFLILLIFRGEKISGVLSFFFFTAYLVIYCLLHKTILVKYMYLFLGIAFYFVGNSICDLFPVYLVELGVNTYYVGSLPMFAFAYWVYLSLLSIIDRKLAPFCYRKREVKYWISDSVSINSIIIRYGRVFVFLLSTLLFLSVIDNPAFLSNMNRFNYAKTTLSGFLFKVRTIPVLLCPIVVMATVKDKKMVTSRKKVFSVFITYIPYFLFGLWIGNKFGLFWQLFYSLTIPSTIYLNLEKLKNEILIKYIIIVFIALFCFVMVFYVANGNNASSIVEKIIRRFSAQGEIWWKVVESDRKPLMGFTSFKQEIIDILVSFKTKGTVKEYGVYKFMNNYGSISYIKHYFDMDMRFSAMGFEMAYCFWGLFSFLIFPIFSLPLFVIITNTYINSVRNNDFLGAFALLRILIVYDSSVCQGDWYRFGSTLDLLIFTVLIFSVIVRVGPSYSVIKNESSITMK